MLFRSGIGRVGQFARSFVRSHPDCMRTQTDVIDAEWEVLPPEEKDKRARLELLFRWIAVVMDELIALPNSKFKFGLDPLIGLIPGIGDTASAIVSALLLIQAARRRLPKIL